MTELLKPRRPPRNGTVGIIAPASPADDSAVRRGIAWWQHQGYRVKTGRHVFDRDYYLAGAAEARAADMIDFFVDDEVDIIHVTQGGYGSAQLIPLLDFELIRANPKPFIGMSDITSLHVAMFRKTGLVTFYGPGAVRLGADSPDETGKRLLQVLQGDCRGPLPKQPSFPYLRVVGSGRASGPLVGGDIYEIRGSLGTDWATETADSLLFFEDEGNPPWQMDGILDQLRQAGRFESVRGIAIGELVNCDWTDEKRKWAATKTLEQVIDYYLSDLGVPVLYGLPIGHGQYNMTIPLGVAATMDADAGTLQIDESPFAD